MAKRKVEECPSCGNPFSEHPTLDGCFKEYMNISPAEGDPQAVSLAKTYLPVRKIRQEGSLFILGFEKGTLPDLRTQNLRFEVHKLIMQAKEMAEPRNQEQEEPQDEPEPTDGTE